MSVVFAFVLLTTPFWAASCDDSSAPSSCEEAELELESGVKVVDMECGDGDIAESGSSIQVDYVGSLANGEEFDSTVKRGPYTFRLGAGQVVDGLDEGLEGMRVGGTRRVTIPPDYAYGNIGLPPLVPADATVVYEIELLKVTEPEL